MNTNRLINTLLDSTDSASASRLGALQAEHNLLLKQGALLSQQGQRMAQQDADQAQKTIADLRAMLASAQNTVKEWQATNDAWRDLALALRDETKACPNEEAHRFGKDDAARKKRLGNFENQRRIELGLRPRPERKPA